MDDARSDIASEQSSTCGNLSEFTCCLAAYRLAGVTGFNRSVNHSESELHAAGLAG